MINFILESKLYSGLLILFLSVALYYVVLFVIYGPEVYHFNKKANVKVKKTQKKKKKKEEKKGVKNDFIKIMKNNNNNIDNFAILAEDNAPSRVPEMNVDDISIQNLVTSENNKTKEHEFFDFDKIKEVFYKRQKSQTEDEGFKNLLESNGISIKGLGDFDDVDD